MPHLKTRAYLTLEMTFAAGKSDSALRPEILSYHDQIETTFFRLASMENVTKSVSSADELEKNGKAYWVEELSLCIHDLNIIDPVAAKIIELVRKAGIKFNHQFSIQKQIVKENDRREIYSKRIHARRASNWVRYQVSTTLNPPSKKKTPFPPRLAYLAEMAGRCDGVGGDDVFVLFREESDLERFLTDLSSKDRKELVAIYQQIVRQKHNEWFLKWLKEHPEDRSRWIDELYWFLSVLDRLREGGLMEKSRGHAKKTVLRYWDDYLCGEPCMEV